MNRTLARLSLAAATAAANGGPARTFAAAALPGYAMRDLAPDSGITAANPQRDSYGDANVRSFPQGSNLEDPSAFTRLGTYATTPVTAAPPTAERPRRKCQASSLT